MQGLKRVRWPGRVHLLQQHPWILLDGTINRASASIIGEIIQAYATKHITAILCIPRPKDLDGVCATIAPFVQQIIVTEITEIDAPTLTWYPDARTIASRYCRNSLAITDVNEAFDHTLSRMQPEDGLLLLGTQSFVGAALDFWQVETSAVW
jgi:dihydrofolate synthase/folylpolyglutamate synthase